MSISVLLAAFVFTACNPSAPQPTAPPLPTFAGGEQIAQTVTSAPVAPTLAPTNEPTTDPDRVWGTPPVGTSKATITFYSQNGQPCIRLMIDSAQTTPTDRCERRGTNVVATQSVVTDSIGQVFTVIAGRILNAKIAVVSIELDKADNTPAQLSDSGFFVALPGQRTAISVVPIDQFGNLVGGRYLFR